MQSEIGFRQFPQLLTISYHTSCPDNLFLSTGDDGCLCYQLHAYKALRELPHEVPLPCGRDSSIPLRLQFPHPQMGVRALTWKTERELDELVASTPHSGSDSPQPRQSSSQLWHMRWTNHLRADLHSATCPEAIDKLFTPLCLCKLEICGYIVSVRHKWNDIRKSSDQCSLVGWN